MPSRDTFASLGMTQEYADEEKNNKIVQRNAGHSESNEESRVNDIYSKE